MSFKATSSLKPFRRALRALAIGLLGTGVAAASLAAAYASSLPVKSATGSGGQAGPGGQIDLGKLTKGQVVNGFRTDAVYLVDSGKPVGARFRHINSGFIFDILQVQTAPQAFMWVNTPPTSDMGESHTQEHLLLGKGNKGRSVANLEVMSMTSSTAMTMQWRTCYHFNTTAGADVFYEQVERRLDALLHPDYTDIEVAREVRNFGVSKDPQDGRLKLEEKGTVYNEMVSSVKSPGHNLRSAQTAALYGEHHPLHYTSGGTPEGLRRLTADDIRAFRRKQYVLHNMGMIAAVPKSMTVTDVLSHLNTILIGLDHTAVAPASLDISDVPDFPPPQPVAEPPDKIKIVSYPEKDPEKTGSISLFWPAVRSLSAEQELLMELFLDNLAGDPATPLYKRFIDRKTRFMDLGATGVGASVSDELGFPVTISLGRVAKININAKVIAQVRDQVKKELDTIASWPDGSPELAAFNTRLKDRIISTRRSYGKFVNSPPGFGNRWQGAGWMGLFLTVGRSGGFYRSVTLKPEIAFAEKELSFKTNIWRHYLKDWHITDTEPFAFATKPDPDLLTKEEDATKERLRIEVDRLKKVYAVDDEQSALSAYKADYDRETERLEALAKQDKPAKLVESLPLTTDDQLEYKVGTIGNVPIVSSIFDTMTGATAGLAMRADGVEQEDLLYLSFLPMMLNSVGVIIDGKPVSYDQMLDRWRQEILSVGTGFSSNSDTRRFELVVRGSGNDPQEVERAIAWMDILLQHPDWRIENLARIRDVVDHSLTGLRSSRQGGYEESWVHSVSGAYWRQDWPLYMATRCFLTRTHDAQRLRWLLKGDAPPEAIKTFVDFMARLSSEAGESKRDDLKAFLDALQGQAGASAPLAFADLLQSFKSQSKDASALTLEAAKDLTQDLADIPDETLSRDWRSLCTEITADIQVPPAATLARFDKVRRKILTTDGARLFTISADSTAQKMQAPLQVLLQSIGAAPFKAAQYSTSPFVLERMRQHDKEASRPVYVGFVNANSQQGVFLYSAPALKYSDTDKESLLRYLAFQQYAGGGSHSMFMQTWGAGLAYSSGFRQWPNDRMSYYADKAPALPETMKFVAAKLKSAPKDLDLTDYSIAGCFSSMAAQIYEGRGESIADSLKDDEPPSLIKHFRQAILDLRSEPDLATQLYERILPQYGKLVPGLGVQQGEVPDSVYMVVGDDKQMKLYEEYLKATVGPDVKLHRIYGRDFWQFGSKNSP